ncbi:MAG TPA: hypothetical protein GX740_02550 [Acholeplasmataceae bacterium]|nr:hypothetical protein [Acholeplasmataceae bacterium]
MKKHNFLLLLLLILTLVGCKKPVVEEEEEFKPEKIEAEHSFIVDDFSSYIKLSTNLFLEEEEIVPKHSITAFMHIVKGVNREITYYQYDWVTVDGTFDTYYKRDFSEPSRFIAQQFLPFVKVSGNEIDTISGLIKYKSKLDDVLEERVVKYKEEILKFNQSDFTNNSNHDEILNFNVYKFDFEDNDYHFKFAINFEIEAEPIHIDMQSWIKTKDDEVYPLMGLYNYATYSENYLSVSDEIVSGIVDIEEIYVKLVYIYKGNTKVITNIFNINDLVPLEEE